MNIADYNRTLDQYNAAWQVVSVLRQHVQQADAYLSAYGVQNRQSELHFQINPRAHVEAADWPSADAILKAVADLKEIGEQVVSAFNHLKPEDRYLVKLPKLMK